ncbi:MAG: hypothetical protein IT289_12475 [Oligoflexia bacterium]|nr:hypothetical protein [Oligoflexia bacterium]
MDSLIIENGQAIPHFRHGKRFTQDLAWVRHPDVIDNMNRYLISLIAAIMIFGITPELIAQSTEQTPLSGPFGFKPIQLSIGKDGIKRKEGGFVCDLSATFGGAHYSEWGETEKDARTIVMKSCEKGSGTLICKADNIKCREEK